MNDTQKAKLFDICRRSKRGLPVTQTEHTWARKMYDKYPDEYREVSEAGNKQAVKEYLGPFAPSD